MQGVAAAFDMAVFGDAEEVILADKDPKRAKRAAARVNSLTGKEIAKSATVDASDQKALIELIKGSDVLLSAVPYHLNLTVAKAAIEAGTSMCDLGGNTEVVFEQLKLDQEAKRAGITIIPDCGLMPGMGNTLAVYGMSKMAKCSEVRIYCGGLPQNPKPPLDYKLVFSIEGLTNEYFGKAYILRDGKVTQIDTFTELEEIEFPPPVGRCEAFITSGGTSTCPWTFEGKVERYEYKTVRYPGHYEKFKTLLELGLLDLETVRVGDADVRPRDVFHKVVAPRINFPDDPDVVVLRVICQGERDGRPFEIIFDVMDFYDPKTGFTAMERTTGFSAAIIAIMIAQGKAKKGAIPLERAVSASDFVAELLKRGIKLTKTVKRPLN